MSAPSRLAQNRAAILERVRKAELRAGRPIGSCRVLAVVKRWADDQVAELLDLGHRELAESRVQARHQRPEEIASRADWHLIGHLQTNKVRRALQEFRVVHSLDSVRLAEAIATEAGLQNRPCPAYLQVNISGEPEKTGCPPEHLDQFARTVVALPSIELVGLMGMAPRDPDLEVARGAFRELARLSRELRENGILPANASGLSMGMSRDYEVAVEEGATQVRVGSAFLDAVA